MNTVKSFWYLSPTGRNVLHTAAWLTGMLLAYRFGMSALTLAGGGAYYFAKKEIDADRRNKHLEIQRRQREQHYLQYGGGENEQRSPAAEASSDPAPTRHEPDTEAQKAREKSKYEATDVYRSPKGDRFT